MKAKELREKYIQFFEEKGHKRIPSASLIPENDPTVLFTTAGMHPLVPYLMGEKHPAGNKLVSIQKCIRTGDIEEVGNETHHTFFEMLGNWSLGDYFKKEAIEMSWEFLIKELKLEADRIFVTIFEGDKNAPFDEEAYEIWKSVGIPEDRIKKLDKKENWWGPIGETGPCGPDTEIFYNNIEIWNNVFMQYNKNKEGKYEPLVQKNVDTGMGLERTLAILNKETDNYKTELWLPIIEKIEELSGKKYDDYTKEMRIVADHIKASVFIISDGIHPSKMGQGYVLRRLIRRVVRYINLLEIPSTVYVELIIEVDKIYTDVYPNLLKEKNVYGVIIAEVRKFKKTLENGEKILNKLFHEVTSLKKIREGEKASLFKNYDKFGDIFFTLFSTHGFPLELSIEILEEKSIEFNLGEISDLQKEKIKESFEKEMKKHSELSKTASAGMFKGGLADNGEETKKLHTTAHLMLEALRQVLGNHIQQKGSNITSERLRFDFSHLEKMTDGQKEEVENIVNEQIQKKLPVIVEEMTLDEAKKSGATGVFDSKYGDKVKVYSIGNFSKEICGGPHVDNTSELGEFKIKKEESVSAGVRRIKAILK